MTQEELEYEAGLDLSNFAGQGLDNEGGMYDNYDGGDDPFLDFAGISKTFADAVSRDTIFTLNLVNAAVATRTALLFGGYQAAPAGLIAEGAFNDTAGNAGLTGTGTPSVIGDLLAFLNQNPTMLAGFKVSSTVALQVEQQ